MLTRAKLLAWLGFLHVGLAFFCRRHRHRRPLPQRRTAVPRYFLTLLEFASLLLTCHVLPAARVMLGTLGRAIFFAIFSRRMALFSRSEIRQNVPGKWYFPGGGGWEFPGGGDAKNGEI